MRKLEKSILLLSMGLFLVFNLSAQEEGKEKRVVEVEMGNLIKDGDFEKELGWEVVNQDKGKWVYDDKIFKSGERSIKISPLDSNYPQYFVLQQYTDKLKGAYYFQAYCRISEDYNGSPPSVSINIYPLVPDAFKKEFVTVKMPEDAPSNEWVKVSKEFEVPEGASVYIQIFFPGTRGSVWFDDIFMGSK